MKVRLDGEVLRAFYEDRSYFSGILGPVGSGKSSICVLKLLALAREQEPDFDGVRRSRWLVVRRTYAELRTTTIATWLEWLAPFGTMRWSAPYEYVMRLDDVEMHAVFLALDRADTLDKVRSLEVTGAWINEAREIAYDTLEAVLERCGRYPSRKNGPGPTWFGAIADTNAPHQYHWWALLSGDVEPPEWLTEDELPHRGDMKGWRFFKQPPAVLRQPDDSGRMIWVENPNAENRKNLASDYYQRLLQGRREGYIRTQLACEYGVDESGQAVYREFERRVHVDDRASFMRGGPPIVLGVDYGRTPAVVVCQRRPDGGWHVLDEILAVNVGAQQFVARYVLPKLQREYGSTGLVAWGDPAGEHLTQADERSPALMWRSAGIPIRPAPVQDPLLRIGAVESALSKLVGGKPYLIVHPRCRTLIMGFEGGYRFATTPAGEIGTPLKNRYSHVHDALQYAMVGEGEHRIMLRSPGEAPRVRRAEVSFGKVGTW